MIQVPLPAPLHAVQAVHGEHGAWSACATVFPSADYLLDELDAVISDLARLATPLVARALRRGLHDLFQVGWNVVHGHAVYGLGAWGWMR